MSKHQLKPKYCKHCGGEYIPRNHLQVACSLDCALKRTQERRQKAQEKEQKQRDTKARVKLKTHSQWLREAQTAVNGYIRARDYGKPCISCGFTYGDVRYGGVVDAGHYRSRGAASHLRFHLTQIRGQCVKCNRNLSGNAVEFRKGLIKIMGEEAVLAIEHDNGSRKFSLEYLDRLKRLMNKRARYYRKRKGL